MKWGQQLKEAHAQGGPLAVSKLIMPIMNDASGRPGHYNMREIYPKLESAGIGGITDVMHLCQGMIAGTYLYDVGGRGREDTAVKQARWLRDRFKMHPNFPHNVPDEYQFMVRTAELLLDELVQSLNDWRDVEQKRASRLSQRLRETLPADQFQINRLVMELSKLFISKGLTGPNLKRLYADAVVLKLTI